MYGKMFQSSEESEKHVEGGKEDEAPEETRKLLMERLRWGLCVYVFMYMCCMYTCCGAHEALHFTSLIPNSSPRVVWV